MNSFILITASSNIRFKVTIIIDSDIHSSRVCILRSTQIYLLTHMLITCWEQITWNNFSDENGAHFARRALIKAFCVRLVFKVTLLLIGQITEVAFVVRLSHGCLATSTMTDTRCGQVCGNLYRVDSVLNFGRPQFVILGSVSC